MVILYAIYDKWLDIWSYVTNQPPIWRDAMSCGKLFCRYCGGRNHPQHDDE